MLQKDEKFKSALFSWNDMFCLLLIQLFLVGHWRGLHWTNQSKVFEIWNPGFMLFVHGIDLVINTSPAGNRDLVWSWTQIFNERLKLKFMDFSLESLFEHLCGWGKICWDFHELRNLIETLWVQVTFFLYCWNIYLRIFSGILGV